MQVQVSAFPSGSPGGGARPPSRAANAAAGPNSSSGAAPVPSRCPHRSSTVAAICSAGTPVARSASAGSVRCLQPGHRQVVQLVEGVGVVPDREAFEPDALAAEGRRGLTRCPGPADALSRPVSDSRKSE